MEEESEMKKSIKISTKARKEKAKSVQIEECYKRREEQILEEQQHKTFTQHSWFEAWACGWLKSHGLNIYSFPSPFLHYKKLFRYSKEPYFKNWREEIRANHIKYKETMKNA